MSDVKGRLVEPCVDTEFISAELQDSSDNERDRPGPATGPGTAAAKAVACRATASRSPRPAQTAPLAGLCCSQPCLLGQAPGSPAAVPGHTVCKHLARSQTGVAHRCMDGTASLARKWLWGNGDPLSTFCSAQFLIHVVTHPDPRDLMGS